MEIRRVMQLEIDHGLIGDKSLGGSSISAALIALESERYWPKDTDRY